MDTETSSGSVLTTLRQRVRSALDTVNERGRSVADVGKKKVTARQRAKQRDTLLRELGELYYEALSEGRDGPSEHSRDKVVADLDALEADDDTDIAAAVKAEAK